MRRKLVWLAGVVLLAPILLAQQRTIVLKTDRLLDGRGHLLTNKSIVLRGPKIAAVESQANGAVYDLRGLTVMPGWIDVHTHITWHFGPKGRFEEPQETSAQATLAAAANAFATLSAGGVRLAVGWARLLFQRSAGLASVKGIVEVHVQASDRGSGQFINVLPVLGHDFQRVPGRVV